MSTVKEQIKEFAIEYDEAEQRKRAAQDLTRRRSPAEMALSMSAGGALDADLRPRETKERTVESVGSQFIDSNFILLDWLKCPEHLRPLVVVIAGLSGGEWREYTPIPQSLIGKRLGIGRETVAERLEELVRWMAEETEEGHRKAVIFIRKRDREQGGEHHYQTTEYLPIIVKYAADFIRQLDARGLKPVNRHQAITDNTVSLYDNTAKEVIATMPDATTTTVLTPRKAVKNVTPKQTKINFIEAAQDRIRRDFEELRQKVDSQSYDFNEIWSETVKLAEKAFFRLE